MNSNCYYCDTVYDCNFKSGSRNIINRKNWGVYMTSWSCLKAAKVITTSDLTAKSLVFFDGVITVKPMQEESKHTHCQKHRHLHKCDKLSYYPCLSSHTKQTLSSPRLRTNCTLWFGLSMQPWYMLELCGGLLVPPHFLEGSVSGAWKLPNGRNFTRPSKLPISSPPPLTSNATWPKAMRIHLKKSPGFTLSSFVSK